MNGLESVRRNSTFRDAGFAWKIAVLALCLPLFARAAPDMKSVRVAVYTNPPKLYLDARGEGAGIFADILKTIAAAEGWRLEFVPCEWAQCVAAVEAGEIDVLPDVAWSEERGKVLDFHRTPALHSWSQIYRHENVPVSSMLDLDGKRVAVLTGSIQQRNFADYARNFGVTPVLLPVPSMESGFTLVREGRADAVVASIQAGTLLAPRQGLVETSIMFQPVRLFYATGKGRDSALLQAIDSHLDAWLHNPNSPYFDILERWGAPNTPVKVPVFLWWAAAGMAGIMLVAMLQSFLLRRQVKRQTGALRSTEQRLTTILDSVDSLIYIKDTEYRYAYANRALRQFFDLDEADIIGKHDSELFALDIADGIHRNDVQIIEGRERLVVEEMVPDARGIWITVLSTKIPLCRDDGSIYGLCGISTDISERRIAEEANRIAATVFQSEEGMFVVNPGQRLVRVNDAFSELSGLSNDDLPGSELPWFALEKNGDDYRSTMWKTVDLEGRWQGEIWTRRANGEQYPAWLTITAVRNEHGRIVNYVGTQGDITEQKRAQDEIAQLAYYDSLTGLPNRRLLLERLHHSLGSRNRQPIALLFLDLDNFKDLNDSLGHEKGDLLLKQVAERLSACTREGDTVARLGGDEFVILLENIGSDEDTVTDHARRIGQKILAEIGHPFLIGGVTHHTSCSIGAALSNDQAIDMDDLMKRGDLAMYEAKRDGRNTIRFFHHNMLCDVTERLALETELRNALANSDFTLHYQPQVNGAGKTTGAEVLIRWNHPERGLVSPVVFIPIAENSGLILALGDWVLRTACHQLAKWATMPGMEHLTLAVNVSARQFKQPEFVNATLNIVRECGASPAHLKLELTESLLIDDVEATIAKMRELKNHGIGFSLDDFGTGYSSLSYLKRLPLDQLKIDRSFVRDILVDPNDASIAQSIVALAKALGLGLIAEGVETEEQRAFLAEIGCTCCQGYLFGKPMEIAAFDIAIRDNADGATRSCLPAQGGDEAHQAAMSMLDKHGG